MKAYCSIAIFAAAVLAGCYTVPETGRSSLNLVSQSVVESIAVTSFCDLKKQQKVSTNTKQAAEVKQVGLRIVEAARQTVLDLPLADQWEFVLFDDEEMINAFAMPGGKVAVYSGLFKIVKNEAQLAAVLGHEVGHIVARHGNERLSQGLVLSGAGAGLGVATLKQSTETQAAVLSAYGAVATLGIMLPFNRSQESEADYLGLIYMARAGYDPCQAVVLWQNMEKQNTGPNPPEFLSTHPVYQTRIDRLQASMPQALLIYDQVNAQAMVSGAQPISPQKG